MVVLNGDTCSKLASRAPPGFGVISGESTDWWICYLSYSYASQRSSEGVEYRRIFRPRCFQNRALLRDNLRSPVSITDATGSREVWHFSPRREVHDLIGVLITMTRIGTRF
ncbi:hypothetical protein Zmor_027473 [Zophobas morio]|uniref:Uncharacterized protein n=1 Tax=Zophobas morio TaxID=2755281 RepID=A0AA38M2K8_9CUCU|nr:hypothetical protein Zmor_027473 [Zophobas morio]